MANYGTLSVLVRADTSALAKSVRGDMSDVGTDVGRGFASRFGGALKTGAKVIGIGAAAAGAAIVPMFKTGLAASEEWERQQANLRAGLKSTHDAANTSVKGMQDLASTISGYSGQSGLAIQKSEQLLLTFPQIRNEAGKNNDIFNQATKITADMAQRLGKDAPDAAIMLGKALNDPTRGLTALRRVGVAFNDQQTEQVKRLQESGHTMAAQKIIIRELNKEFGGSARMYGKTLPGQIDILRNSFKGAEREMVADMTPALSGVMQTVSRQVLPAFQKLTQAIGPALGPVLRVAAGLLADLAPVFSGMVRQILPIITQLGRLFAPLIRGLAPFVRLLTQALGQTFVGLLRAAMPLVRSLAGVFALFARQLGPMIPQLVQFSVLFGRLLIRALQALMPILRAGLIVALQAIAGVLAVINPILQLLVNLFNNPVFRVIATVIGAIAVAWWGLNAAMMANPVVLIIAGIVAAIGLLVVGIKALIKHWDTVWNGIKTAVKFAWEKVIQPVWNAIKAGIRVMAGVFTWLWHKIIQPVWNGIKKAISLYWNYYLHPIFKAIATAIRVLAAVFRWIWHKVIEPVWNGIKKAISVVWNFIKRRIFDPIGRAVHGVGAVFTWLWHKAIEPVWNGIKRTITVVWGFIKRNIFNPIGKAITGLATAFKWLWHKIIEPVWNGIKNAIMWPWNHVIKPILQAFHDFPATLGKVWRGFKTAIGTIFDNIKKAIGEPIWIVTSKILKPIIDGINFLISKIGIPKIPTKWIESIPHFAEGGRVPGGWGGGDKVIAAVEPGEWVLTKRQAKAIGYGTLRNLPHYASGGLVGGNGNGGEGSVGGGIMPPSTFSFWSAIGGAVSSAVHAVTGVVKKIGDVIVRGVKDLYKLGVEALKAAAHLLRYAAAQAFKAAMLPLIKIASKYAQMKVPPANVMWKTLGMMMLQAIDKAISFIEGNSESDSAESMAGMIAQKAVEVAARQIGKPYVWAKHGPNAFDCSGLVEYSYRMAGYPKGKIPGPVGGIGMNTYQQVKKGHEVNQNSALPGDLVFYFGHVGPQPHHVAIASSAHEVIQAPDAGMNVMRSAPFSAAGMRGDRIMVRRLVKEIAGGVDLGNVPANAKAIWKALRSLGWGKFQAAGALGSMQYEDSSFNPFIIQGGATSRNPMAAGGSGYGIVQWTPGSKLADILRWGHKANNLGNQIWALDQQLKGRSPHPEGRAGKLLRNAKSPYSAGLIFANEYERMGTDTAAGRATSARAYYERLSSYDTGGWLPPGTTLVQNMTRKPEPVLTNDQWAALAAGGGGGGSHYIAGGSLDIGIDSQGRMRAWVQDMILEEADYTATNDRMGGGGW